MQDDELFASTDLLEGIALEPMMAKLSTRYRAGLEPVGAEIETRSKSTSRSSVSRRFVARTETALGDLMAADLSGLDIVALIVDRVHFAGHCCVVALDLGRRHRFVDSPVVLARLRGTDVGSRWLVAGGFVAFLATLPLLVSGPGNDLDVANVFRSGRSIAFHLSYVPSRPPGAPVHEAIVGVLDLLGGPVLTNLASVGVAVALVVGLDRLLGREGVGRGGRWAVALVAANPWFVIAATSTADYVFALAFVVGAALALRSGHPVLAGLLAAASMGSRIGSGALVIAVLAAELTEGPDRTAAEAPRGPGLTSSSVGHHGERDAPTSVPAAASAASTTRRRVATAAAVAAAATAALFIPAALATDGLSFADNDFSTSSPLVQLGRAIAKDLTLLGPMATLVALLALPALWRALRRWRASWLVRFGVVGLVLSQILFVRFPWKMAHLLPALLCVAVLLAVALDERPRLLIALVALQIVFAVFRVDVIAPDDPNAATGGTLRPGVGLGPVVVDWQCRRQHPDAYRGRQKVEVEAAWDCAKPFGR